MESQKYIVEGMDCAECALNIEKGVRQLPGVKNVEVNFALGSLKLEGNIDKEVLRERVEKLGYRLGENQSLRVQKPRKRFFTGFLQFLVSEKATRLALVGGGLILLAYILSLFGLTVWLVTSLQIMALGIAGYPIARSGIVTLVINRDFNMNLLMTLAAVGAVIIGEIPEAASLIFLFAIAEALEGYTAERARDSLGALAELAPQDALLLEGEIEKIVPVAELKVGDRILIKAGERIPMDGVVVSGESSVDQAAITGESLPVQKQSGAEIFAGTVNGGGALEVEVTRLVQDNTLSRIIRMVEEAQSVRAPSQRFIDRFAHFYTPAMVLVASLVAVLPPVMFGEPFLSQVDGTRGWLYRGLALLVIGCPCALVISTPVTIVSAITAAARRGILFKGGAYLEALNKVKVVAFDKTGTLTLGKPVVTDVRSVDCVTDEACDACDEVLALAASLERRSSHPLAKAVVTAAEHRGVDERYPAAHSVQALTGQGVQGWVNGKQATIGNHNLFELEHPHSDRVCNWVEAAEMDGQTAVLVCDGDRVRGYLSLADEFRPEGRQVVQELQTSGKTVAMLTGDNPLAARRIADLMGIGEVKAGLMPGDKVDVVRQLHQKYGAVAMVGDGINDTPALAAASVGVAMGAAGSAQAMETADVVLMSDDLHQLPYAFRLSSQAHSLIIQNIAFSLLTKLVFIGLAVAGLTSMWLAVLADMGVSLLVTLNGMRPLANAALKSKVN